VNSPQSLESTHKIADVLVDIRKRGVRLWSENGQLRYKAPKGVLTPTDLEAIRESKGQLVRLLETAVETGSVEPAPGSAPKNQRSPLSFSQLAHWHLCQLSQRCAIRQIASATRIRGRLHLDVLRRSAAEMIRRHDALRTRIVMVDGLPMQDIPDSIDFDVKFDDLTGIHRSLQETQIKRTIESDILEPIAVASAPLLGMRIMKLTDLEHVLVVVMEHMIADAVSMGILLRDLFSAYSQAMKGQRSALPVIAMQFADYASWQRSAARRSQLERRRARWMEHLNGCPRSRFPAGSYPQTADRPGWGSATIKIDKACKSELHEWCRARQTTVAMGVFTAYVGLLLRWCNVGEAIVRYQSDGRSSPKTKHTIGYFASVLYMRVGLQEGDRFFDLLARVTEEYCQAYDHVDCFNVEPQEPQPEFAQNSSFNWVSQEPRIAIAESDGLVDALDCVPIAFEHPMLRTLETDADPTILLYDTGEEIQGSVHFPLRRFCAATMETFAQNFLRFLSALLKQPNGRVKDISLLD
jgi:hypothetical protein